jgi:broad specificity phosphatase PhoE
MGKDHRYYSEIVNNPKFKSIRDKIPQTESLKTTMLRVIPFWNNAIVPDIKSGKQVLVVCHGTSLRGIVKHIDRKLNLQGHSCARYLNASLVPLTCTFLPTYGWEDNIKMDLKEEGVDWILLAQDRDQWWAVVNMVMKLLVPPKMGYFLRC